MKQFKWFDYKNAFDNSKEKNHSVVGKEKIMVKAVKTFYRRMIVGPLIKKQREDLDLTQNDVGLALGYRYGNFVGMIEKGNSPFPLDKAIAFADVLEIPRHKMIEAAISELYPDLLPYLEFKPVPKEKYAELDRKIEELLKNTG